MYTELKPLVKFSAVDCDMEQVDVPLNAKNRMLLAYWAAKPIQQALFSDAI